MKHVTEQIRDILRASGSPRIHPHGFASCALLTDCEYVCQLNREIRSIKGCWTPDDGDWPDEHWVIGEDGAGNLFVISKDNAYQGVRFFDHEWRRFEPFQESIRDFCDYCLKVEFNQDHHHE